MVLRSLRLKPPQPTVALKSPFSNPLRWQSVHVDTRPVPPSTSNHPNPPKTLRSSDNKPEIASTSSAGGQPASNKRKLTIAEQDAKMLAQLEERNGGGGNAGVEYEDGKPFGLKRHVKDNMFRLI